MADTTVRERFLVFFLRLGGILTLSAFGAVFLPVSWMQATHAWLGLGEFPVSPITDYLSRSAAALYGVHGGLLLVVSMNVRRHRPIVRYLGMINIVLGLMLLGIDLHSGMPAYWTFVEGPPVALSGVALLYLLRDVPSA